LRVETGQQEASGHGAKVMIGNIAALKEEATGTINRTEFTNVTIWFTVAHGQETDDGTVWLVTPTKDLSRERRTFEAFLSQIRFDRQ
jgi:hypothetical protein